MAFVHLVRKQLRCGNDGPKKFYHFIIVFKRTQNALVPNVCCLSVWSDSPNGQKSLPSSSILKHKHSMVYFSLFCTASSHSPLGISRKAQVHSRTTLIRNQNAREVADSEDTLCKQTSTLCIIIIERGKIGRQTSKYAKGIGIGRSVGICHASLTHDSRPMYFDFMKCGERRERQTHTHTHQAHYRRRAAAHFGV